MKKTIKIEGMTCEGCSGRIQNLLNRIPGVDATVSLAAKEAEVNVPDDLVDDILRDTITNAGYQVVEIVNS